MGLIERWVIDRWLGWEWSKEVLGFLGIVPWSWVLVKGRFVSPAYELWQKTHVELLFPNNHHYTIQSLYNTVRVVDSFLISPIFTL